MKIKVDTRLIVGAFFLLMAVLIGCFIYSLLQIPGSEPIALLHEPPKDYLDIFNLIGRKDLKVDYVLKAKYDPVICNFLTLDQNSVIEEYKITINTDKSLPKIISIENKNKLYFENSTCIDMGAGLIKVSYKTFLPKVNHLDVAIFSDSIRTVFRSDSVLVFFSNYKNLSIKCNGSDTSAIFGQPNKMYNGNSLPSMLPIEIAFIKKEKSIYFLIMSGNNEKAKLIPGTLYDLIK